VNEGARPSKDLTVLAVPFYFGAMALEYRRLRRQADISGPTAGTYGRRDTRASLTMGTLSLLAPLVVPRLLRPVTPGKGRYAKVLVGAAAAAAIATTAADAIVRRSARSYGPAAEQAPGSQNGSAPARAVAVDRRASTAGKVASIGGVATLALGELAITTSLTAHTSAEQLWRRRLLPDLGRGPLAIALAVLGWDFIYYWNHRFMHESRYMWAYHVVHHSSEHYNLSTALRQPVAEALGTFIPFGALCLLGVSPALVETARGVNLLYQFWIHTETIGRLGRSEAVMNTPSHHRVHHGSNVHYLDRNHGSILIVWDRLFGTFEPEGEPVVYGLTKNINTYDPARIIGHEYVDIARDVASSTSWSERLSYVVRGPGWATRHRAEVASAV
jgi:sterol desaturase/sphingolipid hydroxylase (fatty acid hydroxylase superfamily)